MTNDVLDSLRRHDPAADLDATPPAEQLERLVAEPRGAAATAARVPLLRRRIVHIAVGLAAAAALLTGISLGRDGGPSPDLAARAYAQTQTTTQILHVVQRLRSDFPAAAGTRDTTGSVESWIYGDEAHTILTSDDAHGHTTFTSDQLLGPDGVLRNHLSDTGETQTLKPSDGPEAREIIAKSRRDFVADFRTRYERGVLDDTGVATFEGRSARLYVVEEAKYPGQREEYYLDAETGAPLGSVTELPIHAIAGLRDGKPVASPPIGTLRSTVVIQRIERLAPTPANLAHVRERG